jgi:hypothetical protein
MSPAHGSWFSRLRTASRHGRRLWSSSLKFLALTVAGRLKRIPIKYVMDEYGFSLAPEGWHYFRALVAQYDQDPGIRLEDTTFYRFFQDERLKSVRYLNDLLFLHQPTKRWREEGFKFYFGTYPWGDFWTRYSVLGGKPWGHHYDAIEGKMTRDLYGYRRNPWYQPGDDYPLALEWDHTIQLYRRLKGGYYPRWYGSLPEVVLLLRRDGDMRAIRCEGHHRLSILSHLGHEQVTVSIPSSSVGVVHESEVEQWFYVKNGLCSPERALEIFDAFFELNGRERVEYLGLPCIY